MKNYLLLAVIVAVIALGASVACCLWLPPAQALPAAVVLLAAALVVVLIMARLNASNAAWKARTIVRAMKNNDFSMRFNDSNNQRLNHTLHEITEITKEEKHKALQHERYFELILNRVNAGIFTLDPSGRVLLCNNHALKLFGINVLTHISQLDRVDKSLRPALLGIAAGEVRLVAFHTKTSDESVSASQSQINMGGNDISIYVLNSVYPVLDRKETEAWTKMTRVLIHEIMNSIAPIRSLSDALVHSHDEKARQEGLETIRETADSLMQFTASCRRFVAIPEPVYRLVYAGELIRHAACLFSNGTNTSDITVVADPADLIVKVDSSLIGQVLVNILKNAIDAGASRITIQARCLNESGAVAIDISDNAPQIPDEIAEQIFVPFFTTKQDGSGIGLSVSRRIMNLHGGTLHLIQPSPEKGFTKTFRLNFP